MDGTPNDINRTPEEPKGQIIGFIETQAACDALVKALIEDGVANQRITVFHDQDGSDRFHEMMDSSQWGEEEQRVLKEGDQELADGHFVICVKAKDRDDALHIALVGTANKGHGFSHFGTLVDERITR